jgi:hypothetical protein
MPVVEVVEPFVPLMVEEKVVLVVAEMVQTLTLL